MFEVGIVGEFEASHALRGDFGSASLPHAHRYRVEVGASGTELQPDGTLFDITRLQGALRVVLATLNGRSLNDVQELVDPNPTAEVVARYFFQAISPSVPGCALTVRVWESAEAYAGYSGEAR